MKADQQYIERLSQRLRRTGRPLSANEAMAVIAPALGHLQAMHNANRYHLNLRPENIAVDSRGNILLLDECKVQFPDPADLDADLSKLPNVANPGFASPEQAHWDPDNIGPWSDFYSLGATMCALLGCKTDSGKVSDIPADIPASLKSFLQSLTSGDRLSRMKPVRDISALLPEAASCSIEPAPMPKPQPQVAPQPAPVPPAGFRPQQQVYPGQMYGNIQQNGGMMFCPECGTRISRLASFCPNCGIPMREITKMGGASAPARPGAMPPPIPREALQQPSHRTWNSIFDAPAEIPAPVKQTVEEPAPAPTPQAAPVTNTWNSIFDAPTQEDENVEEPLKETVSIVETETVAAPAPQPAPIIQPEAVAEPEPEAAPVEQPYSYASYDDSDSEEEGAGKKANIIGYIIIAILAVVLAVLVFFLIKKLA